MKRLSHALMFAVLSLIAQVCEGAAACRCNVTAGAITLAFPVLDPSVATDFTNVATTPDPAFTFTCTGPPPACGGGIFYAVSASGLYNAGATFQMRHATQAAEFIPYTLTVNASPPPPSARGAPVTVIVRGSLFYNDYRGAYFGSYSDILTVNITP